MTWNGSVEASPSARMAALIPSLQRSERRVAEAVLADPERAVESTAQELADAVGVGRASVVRTAQTLGYEGYPQLRVALARERVVAQPAGEVDDGALGVVRAGITRFGGRWQSSGTEAPAPERLISNRAPPPACATGCDPGLTMRRPSRTPQRR